MRLRKCSCGGNPLMYPMDFPNAFWDELRHVECLDCGCTTYSYHDGNRAQRDWNSVQRRKNEQKNRKNKRKT